MAIFDGVRLGTITLCAHCKYAIQLRRERVLVWSGSRGEHYAEVDSWFHFRPPITPHTAAPCRGVRA